MTEESTKSRWSLLEVEQVAKLVVLRTKATPSTKSLFHLDFRGSSRYKATSHCGNGLWGLSSSPC